MAPRRVNASGDSGSSFCAVVAEIRAPAKSFFRSRSQPRSRWAESASMVMGGVYNPQRMRIFVCLVCLTIMSGACPRPGMQPPTTGNAAARDRFDVARARYEVNDYAAAARELERLVQDFPNDPII